MVLLKLSLLTLGTCRFRGSCPGSKAHMYSLIAAAAVPHYDALGTGLSLPAGSIATEQQQHRGHNMIAMKDMHAT